MSLNRAASLAQLKASDPVATVWVNANAGSGKTHVLVDRVVRLMLAGTEPSRIMCLTFTKAAAAEMANRLFERLSTWIVLDDQALRDELNKLGSPDADQALLERARQLFTRALETPGGLKIQTIHAFCERVLQLFPIEAGIVPHFAMLDDRESLRLLQEARNAVLSAAKDETSEIGRALQDVADRVNADTFDRLLTQLLSKRANLRALLEEGGPAEAGQLLRQRMSLAPDVTRDRIMEGLGCDVARYLQLAEALDGGSVTDVKRAADIRMACAGGEVNLYALRTVLLTGDATPRASVVTAPVRKKHGWIEAFVKADQARLAPAVGPLGDLECLGATLSLLRLGGAIVAGFEAAKRARGAYDFDDLIIKTAELLQHRPDAAWVLFKLDGGIEHLLVDEAQDTSPLQWQIVQALTGEFFAGEGRHGRKPRTLFVVGDRKQSIYSFQGADPVALERVLTELRASAEGAEQAFREVDFSVSFRSLDRILKAVDGVFAPGSLARTGLDGAETPREWEHVPNRREVEGTVEVWPLVIPDEKEEPDPWEAPVDREPATSPRRKLAKKLAKTIKGWIGKRLLPARGRAVAAGDILILVRRRDSFFDAMIRALWNEQVPVAGADRLKLGENIAVLDLVALAQFAIMPEDDHALACVLKSPLISRALTEDELIAIAAGRGTRSLWQSLVARGEEPFRSAAEALHPLIAEAPSARPFEFLSAILGKARLRVVSRLGSEANDAIDALLDRALDYEEAHGTSLAGFVNWFEAGEIEIKRNMEQGSGEVRVMTVHGAKGLEAPVVILPDTTSSEQGKSDSLLMLERGDGFAKMPLWVVPKLFASSAVELMKTEQKDIATAEYRRLLYVAMTRACDELYVCGYRGINKPPENCWYNLIEAALTPGMVPPEAETGWRSGEAPVMARQVAAAAAVVTPALPAWVAREAGQLAPAEAPPPARKRAEARVARGILIHRILQNLGDVAAEDRDAHIDAAVRRAGHDAALAGQLKTLIADPVMAELLSADGHSEAGLITRRADGSPERRRIDRLVMTPEGVLVADYKTDREVPAAAADCNPEYLMQLATYRDALRLAAPGLPLRFCLVFTEAPKLMMIPDALLDRMADLRQARP